MSALAGRFRFAPILAATVFTVLLILLVGATAQLFLLLFLAVLLSLYLDAIAEVVCQRTRLPRPAAVLVAVLFTLGLAVGFVWILVPPVAQQTQDLIRVLPNTIVSWENGIDQAMARNPALRSVWNPGQHRVLLAIYQQVSGYFADVLPKLFSALGFTIEIVSVAIMGIYLALHPAFYRELLIALFPPVHRDLARNVLADLSRALRAWIVGQMAAMLLLGGLTAIGLSILGVPYWLTFGIFTGVASIVPFFGSLTSTLLPAVFVLGNGNPGRALGVIILGIVVHLIEGNIVSPLIMQRQVNLPPVLTMMGVLILGKLLGLVGLLLAVPVLVVVDVIVRRILIDRIYEGRGFRRVVRDSAFVIKAPAASADVILPDPQPDVLESAEAVQRRHVA